MSKGVILYRWPVCAKTGIPVALRVDGKLHTLAAPAPMLADYVGHNATVSGRATGELILPEKVTSNSKAVNVGGIM